MFKKYLIAVSGGPDSMALLNSVNKKQIKAVIHVNYNYRHSAKRDYLLVRKYCHQNHLFFFCKNINPKIYQEKNFKNFEAWARKIRYDYFLLASKLTQTKCILVAHHIDDYVETALMQLNQHRWYYGIKKSSYYHSLKILRPFLFNRDKQDLMNYCNFYHIRYGIDETNFDTSYRRNALRLCLTKTLNKRIFNLLINLNNLLEEKYQKIYLVFEEWKKTHFNLIFFQEQTRYEQFCLIDLFLHQKQIRNLSWNKIMQILQFLNNSLNFKQLRIANQIYLKKQKESPFIMKKKTKPFLTIQKSQQIDSKFIK